MNGYKENFIDSKNTNLNVTLPELGDELLQDLAPVGDEGVLHYVHYSLALSKSRKFPFYTATNIDGKRFVRVKRAEVFDSGRDEWSEDERARPYQWGQKLYDAPKSYFDRGHMTKREDPQWGANWDFARKAAQNTFYFTNCIPQIADLNQRIWAELETYILTKQSVKHALKICLFTGPVLSRQDPEFVTLMDGQSVPLPVLFWKVIYYTNNGMDLSRVAFLMGQEDLLIERGIVRPKIMTRTFKAHFPDDQEFFMDYEDAETYQVNVQTIETLTGLVFQPAKDAYTDTRPIKLIKEAVQATGQKVAFDEAINPQLLRPDFTITNIHL